MGTKRLRLWLAAAFLPLILLAGACRDERGKEPLGLFTTLPIYWAEAADIAGMLHKPEQRHWARELIEQRYRVRPLDSLAEPGSLDGFRALLIAQPRALTPEENVALDGWVRRGGHLLMFADPLLTAHSDFPLGDKRRPQDVVLLSPLLTHWRLAFHFDELQPAGARSAELLGRSVPVDMAGRFETLPDSKCFLLDDGLGAECAIGKGRALILADAAVLDGDAPQGPLREPVLAMLLSRAFD